MADYNPPLENLPIFDSSVFLVGDIPLTQNQADKRYLRYPNAQGTENLAAINVNGAAVFNSTVKANTTITYVDNTVQNSAFTGASALAGSYTSTNLTIDANGKITALSNGAGVPLNLTPNSVTITPNPSYGSTAGISCTINNNARYSISGTGGSNVNAVNAFCASSIVYFDYNIGGATTPTNNILTYRINFTFWNSTSWGQTSCLIDFYPDRWTQGTIQGNQLYNINNKINGNASYVYTNATYAPNGRQYWTYNQQFSGLTGAQALFVPHNGYFQLFFCLPDNTYSWQGCIEALNTITAQSAGYGVTLH